MKDENYMGKNLNLTKWVEMVPNMLFSCKTKGDMTAKSNNRCYDSWTIPLLTITQQQIYNYTATN